MEKPDATAPVQFTEADEIAFMERSAQTRAFEWFDDAIRLHEGAVRDLKRYRDQFAEAIAAPSRHTSPESVLGWAAGHTRTPAANMRIDLLSSIGSELGICRFRRSHLAKSA